MLHLRHNERKKSMCNREFQPTKRTYVAPNHRCQGPGSYSCSWSSFGPQVLSTCATAPAFSFGSASRFRDRDWWIGGWTYACPSSFGHQVLSTHATAPAFSIPRAALQFNWNEIFKALATAPRGAEKHQPDSSSVKQQQAMSHGFTFCGQADMVATAPVEEVVSRFRRQETIRREVAILYAKRFLGEWELYSGLLQHQFTVLKIRALRTRQQEQDLQQDYCDKLTKRGELTVFRFWQASDQFPRQEMTEKEKYYQERMISKLNIMRQNFLQKSSERRMLRLNFPEKIRYDVVEPHYGNLPYDIGKSILSGPHVLSTCATAPAFSFGKAERFDWCPDIRYCWPGHRTYACPSSFGHQVLSMHATAPAFSIRRTGHFDWNRSKATCFLEEEEKEEEVDDPELQEDLRLPTLPLDRDLHLILEKIMTSQDLNPENLQHCLTTLKGIVTSSLEEPSESNFRVVKLSSEEFQCTTSDGVQDFLENLGFRRVEDKLVQEHIFPAETLREALKLIETTMARTLNS